MQAEADSSSSGMEENGTIEPLGDDDLSEGAGETTSDYDESEGETTFGSLTSSVSGHVWEYGRYATGALPTSFTGVLNHTPQAVPCFPIREVPYSERRGRVQTRVAAANDAERPLERQAVHGADRG